MSQTGSSVATVLEKLREFDRLASQLDMPRSERLNILDLSDVGYSTLCLGQTSAKDVPVQGLVRRLSYALPLMRRLVKAAGPNGDRTSPDPTRLHAA